MRIIVLVKEVPDTDAERHLHLETGLTDRETSEKVLDEITERATELAVSHAEQHPDTEIVLLTVSPETAQKSLRRGLAMGADRAVHVVDERLRGADLTLTAEVLAAAATRIGFDLIVAGDTSTDGMAGVLPAILAARLHLPHASSLQTAVITQTHVNGDQEVYGATRSISTPLPAVISITEQLPDPRLPGFSGIMSAKKKPFETWTLDELGVDADHLTPRSIMVSVSQSPARQSGTKIVDEGDAGKQLADFLIQNALV